MRMTASSRRAGMVFVISLAAITAAASCSSRREPGDSDAAIATPEPSSSPGERPEGPYAPGGRWYERLTPRGRELVDRCEPPGCHEFLVPSFLSSRYPNGDPELVDPMLAFFSSYEPQDFSVNPEGSPIASQHAIGCAMSLSMQWLGAGPIEGKSQAFGDVGILLSYDDDELVQSLALTLLMAMDTVSPDALSPSARDAMETMQANPYLKSEASRFLASYQEKVGNIRADTDE